MNTPGTKVRALSLTTIVLFAVVAGVLAFSTTGLAYSKSTGDVSVGNATMVGVRDATIDPSNESRIPVSINVSDSGLQPSEIELKATNTNTDPDTTLNTTLLSDADFSSNASTGNLTLSTNPVSPQFQSFTLNVTAYNANTDQPISGAVNESTITIDDTTAPEISAVSLDNNGFDKVTLSFNSSEKLGRNAGNLSVTVSGPNGASYSFDRNDFLLTDSSENFTYEYGMRGTSQSYDDGEGTYTASIDTAEDHHGNDGQASASDNDYSYSTPFSSKTIKNLAGGPDLDTSNVTMYTTKFGTQFVFVRLENDTSSFNRRDLAGEGATEQTELWVNFTVDGFNPDALMGTANVQSWDYTMNGDGSANVNVSLKPASTERNFSAWRNGVRDPANWGASYEGSDLSMDAVVDFGIGNMSGAPGSPQGLDGARLTSDAQAYTVPSLDNSGNLSIDVASPHCVASTSPPADQCSGDEINDGGFYKAVIPSAFYQNEWGVSELSAGDIDVQYSSSGSSSTDTQWDISVRNDGAIVLNGTNLHYSEGTVNIIQSEESDSSGSDDSGGGGSSGISTDVTTEESDTGATATIDGVKVDDPTVSVPVEDVATDAVSVTEASVTFAKGSNRETQVEVSASASRPSSVTDSPDGEVVSYVTVDVTGSLEDGVSEGSFTLELADADASPQAVRVHRYHDGEWQPVETTVVDENTVKVHTPGFSVFAVEVADGTTAQTATVTPTASGTVTTPATQANTQTQTQRTATKPSSEPGAQSTGAGDSTTARSTEPPAPTSTPTGGQAGFGMLVGVLAIVGSLVAATRRYR